MEEPFLGRLLTVELISRRRPEIGELISKITYNKGSSFPSGTFK